MIFEVMQNELWGRPVLFFGHLKCSIFSYLVQIPFVFRNSGLDACFDSTHAGAPLDRIHVFVAVALRLCVGHMSS